ncbi:MAG: hypothetical protein H7Y08_02630 [Rhizobiaceae bacterium]|nr:hypothetical protein [Rhizobiaceae bacterium]
MKFNGAFKRLGDVQRTIKADDRTPSLLYTVADVKELANRVRDIMKAGQDPDPYIAERAKGALHEKAAATSDSIAAN